MPEHRYKIVTTKYFDKKLAKLLNSLPDLAQVINEIIIKLSINPWDPSLKTHKVNAIVSKDKVRSSSVTGDIRIIWDFDENNNLIIVMLTIGSHSGSNKVYK